MALRYLAWRVGIPDLQLRGRRVSLPTGSRPLTARYSQRPGAGMEEFLQKNAKAVARVLNEEEIASLRARAKAVREAMEELKRHERYGKLWLGTCAATGVGLGLLAAAADIRRQQEALIRNFYRLM